MRRSVTCVLVSASLWSTALAQQSTTTPSNTAETKAQRLAAICDLIEQSAQSFNMPPGFLARLLWQESRFNANAVSPKGAQGIAQFMPATAQERGLDDPFDPKKAIPASAAFLNDLRIRFGNLGLAAAGYNGGPNRVGRWQESGGRLPLETEEFVLKITGVSAADWNQKLPPKPTYVIKEGVPFKEACRTYPITRVAVAASTEFVWQPWGVHIISHRSRSRALAVYNNVRRKHRSIIDEARPMVLVQRKNSFGRRARYAVRIGKQNRGAAQSLCRRLKAVGQPCLVYKTPRR